MMTKQIELSQIKAIWASARECGLDKQTVYDIIAGVSGKESMKQLTYDEALQVLDRINGKNSSRKQKRTDTGGKAATVPLRQRIYSLTGQLGWNHNNSRINGFCKRMTGVERIEWLNVQQCHQVIEGLKKMVKRQEEKK